MHGRRQSTGVAGGGPGLRARGARGVTLLELFLAIALSIILSLIIYSVVISQSRAYNIQDQMTVLQQNLRFSMDFISRNVAMAGYGTNGTVLVDTDEVDSTGMLLAIRGLDGGAGSSDALQVVYTDPTKLAMTKWAKDHSCDTTQLEFQNGNDASLFNDSSWMICFDYSDTSRMKSFLFKIKSTSTTSGAVGVATPTNNNAYYGAGGQCPSSQNLPRDLQCGPAQVLTFYIDRVSDGIGPGTPARPVLMMSTNVGAINGTTLKPASDDSALADNVEDLQVKVCSTNASDTIGCADSVDWTNWSATLNSSTSVVDVRQVKVTLWARSDRKNPEGKTTVSAPNPLTNQRDGYFRQMESTTILVRNLRLLEDYN